jgi:hypothetical protein
LTLFSHQFYTYGSHRYASWAAAVGCRPVSFGTFSLVVMKSARRHEPDLNLWLTQQMERLEEHKNTIITVAVAAIAAIVIAAFMLSAGDPRAAADWQSIYESYATSNRARDLKNIADNSPRPTSAVLWARKSLADEQLREGTEKLFIDRSEASDLLESAAKNYQEVAEKAGGHSSLVAQAQLGLGRVNESQGNVDAAKKHYAQAIAAAGKDSVFGKVAADGIKRLADPRTAELLAWFQDQKPKPPKSSLGLPPAGGFDAPLPDRPDIGFPASPLNDATGKSAGDKPAEESKPKEDGKDLPLDKPSTAEPKDSKPGEAPVKPAEEKPAEEKPADKSTGDDSAEVKK